MNLCENLSFAAKRGSSFEAWWEDAVGFISQGHLLSWNMNPN